MTVPVLWLSESKLDPLRGASLRSTPRSSLQGPQKGHRRNPREALESIRKVQEEWERNNACQRSQARPREAKRGPEKPRQAQRYPERRKDAQICEEMPREAQRSPEKPREAKRGPEKLREAQKSPDKPTDAKRRAPEGPPEAPECLRDASKQRQKDHRGACIKNHWFSV